MPCYSAKGARGRRTVLRRFPLLAAGARGAPDQSRTDDVVPTAFDRVSPHSDLHRSLRFTRAAHRYECFGGVNQIAGRLLSSYYVAFVHPALIIGSLRRLRPV